VETIWAVAMVRNERRTVGRVIRHLLAEGVDHVLVADNLSVDGTHRILDRLAASLPVTVVDDPDPAFRQAEKMTELARRAGRSGADWIVPFDGDELWVNTAGTLREALDGLDADVVVARWLQHYAPPFPLRRDPFRSMAWRDAEPDLLPKVAFRYRDGVELAMGSHAVSSPEPLRHRDSETVEVHNYRYRSFPHMLAKSRQGRRAVLLADEAGTTCWHWRLHGGRSGGRLALTWLKMSLRRKGRVRDLTLPNAG